MCVYRVNTPHALGDRRGRRRGFSLVEVVLALGIAAYVLISLFGLLHVGLATQHESVRETEAAHFATSLIADLREVPAGQAAPVSSRYGIDLNTEQTELFLNDAGERCADISDARYRVAVRLRAPAYGERRATTGSVTLSWPPAADEPLGEVALFIALNRN